MLFTAQYHNASHFWRRNLFIRGFKSVNGILKPDRSWDIASLAAPTASSLPLENNMTICGGRVSGTKSTGRKQFFSTNTISFISIPVNDRCTKCQAAYEAKMKAI